MYVDWTKHLKDPEDKVEFEQYIKGSKRLLTRISDLISEYEKSLERSETDIKSFDNPNWAYLQAYKNGYRSCLQKLKELVSIDQKDNK